VRGFVFDLTGFSRRSDLERSLGCLVQCMVTIFRGRGVLNWLRGSRFVGEWRRLKLFGMPPDNYETEQEAVAALRTTLRAEEIRTGLAQRLSKSAVSVKEIASLTGLMESDVRRIAERLEEPSDAVALQISSALDALS
jgi:hypothetical protein